MSGIADVARVAGVSKSTASRALTGSGYVSEATRRRVEAAAEALGYVASTHAVNLATGRTQTVGVVMPYVTHWFYAEVLEGIQETLLSRELDLTLYVARPGTTGRDKIFEWYLTRRRFDGLIVVGLEPADDELRRILSVGRPVVSVVGPGQDGTSVIEIDDTHAARRATDHLIALGHRRIMFVGGGDDDLRTQVDRRRLQGYRESMREAGLEQEMSHIASPATIPGGYAAAADLLGDSRIRPTAVIGTCDEVSIGTIIAARRLGIRVPTDLSVIGIDDHEYAEMFGLTTLKQVPWEQGAAAVELLLAQMHDKSATRTSLRLRARLVMRSSTAPPPGRGSVIVLDSPLREESGRVAGG
jgi:DNA-binding LacI/PurR family transcriptional regulator